MYAVEAKIITAERIEEAEIQLGHTMAQSLVRLSADKVWKPRKTERGRSWWHFAGRAEFFQNRVLHSSLFRALGLFCSFVYIPQTQQTYRLIGSTRAYSGTQSEMCRRASFSFSRLVKSACRRRVSPSLAGLFERVAHCH